MATSGNYRNYYESGGMKFSHTIDPATGKPVNHNLLSATVLAETCMEADAFATAIMVMGLEKAIALQESEDNFEIFLIYSDTTGQMKSFASEGLKPFLSFVHE
jgi:thiamine biosynthesis lipoprotein